MAAKKKTTKAKVVKKTASIVKHPPHIHEQHPNLIWLLLLFIAVLVGVYVLKVSYLDPHYMPESMEHVQMYGND